MLFRSPSFVWEPNVVEVVDEPRGVAGGLEAVERGRGQIDAARVPADDVKTALDNDTELGTRSQDKRRPGASGSAWVDATGTT